MVRPFGQLNADPEANSVLLEPSGESLRIDPPLLSSAGYQVTRVAGPAEALALCDAGRDYDVIVSDLEQPARDGLALAATIRGGTRWRATPMVAVSDRASPRDQVRGRLAGFDDHVAKSDRKALLSALEDTLNRARGPA